MSPRGVPRTLAQRKARHQRIFSNTKVPKVRKGKNRK